MKPPLRLLAAALPLALLAACGGGSTSSSGSSTPSTAPASADVASSDGASSDGASPSSAPSDSSVSLADAQAALLTASDFPSGWTAGDTQTEAATPSSTASPSASDDTGGLQCTGTKPASTKTGVAGATFTQGKDEVLEESINTYADEIASKAAFDDVTSYLATCTSFVDQGLTFTLSALSLPQAGDSSTAVQGVAPNHPEEDVDIAYSVTGSAIVEISHVNVAPIDSTFTGTQLLAAVGKLAG